MKESAESLWTEVIVSISSMKAPPCALTVNVKELLCKIILLSSWESV